MWLTTSLVKLCCELQNNELISLVVVSDEEAEDDRSTFDITKVVTEEQKHLSLKKDVLLLCNLVDCKSVGGDQQIHDTTTQKKVEETQHRKGEEQLVGGSHDIVDNLLSVGSVTTNCLIVDRLNCSNGNNDSNKVDEEADEVLVAEEGTATAMPLEMLKCSASLPASQLLLPSTVLLLSSGCYSEHDEIVGVVLEQEVDKQEVDKQEVMTAECNRQRKQKGGGGGGGWLSKLFSHKNKGSGLSSKKGKKNRNNNNNLTNNKSMQ
eukprot:GHVS01061161.1.p1 GENE.GHVS01061161.1~~GHVS01061161.1.p1  ORF type:complete len:264 (-),score=81.44 GHVS01061161.1:407-1198(-)